MIKRAILVMVLLATALPAAAQGVAAECRTDFTPRLSPEGGWYPESLQEMVCSSPIIVRGSYGECFVGRHEIHLIEVLKNEDPLDDGASTFHLSGCSNSGSDTTFFQEYFQGEHLFFAHVASTGELVVRGSRYRLQLKDGRYVAYSPPEMEEVTLFGSEDAEAFLTEIRRLVSEEAQP